MDLKQLTCEPCRGAATALPATDYPELLAQLPGWQITDRNGIPVLTKTYNLPSYRHCLTVVQQIGDLAERHDHHPEMTLSWGKVQVNWWTHTLGGLHLNDFILAAQCDGIAGQNPPDSQ